MICGQMVKKRAAGIAFVVGAFFLLASAGCIKVDQTLTLEKDGSGTIDLTYSMSEQNLARWQDMANGMFGSDAGGTAMPFDFTDQDIRDDFKEFEKDGVVLQSIRSETRNGWKTRRLLIGFKSLAGVAKTGFLANRDISLVKDASGNYVFTQKAGGAGNLPPEIAAMTEPPADMLFLDMMQGFKAALRVKTPGLILETNAPQKSDREAAWTFDIDRDPDALRKIQKTSLRIVFDGKGLDIPAFHSAPARWREGDAF